MELNKSVQVNILHVENPYKFWFRTETDSKKLSFALKLLETEMERSNNYTPRGGDIVIAKIYKQLGVATVKSVIDENYVEISNIDNRQIHQLPISDLTPLRDQSVIDLTINTVQKGSISGIFPVKKEIRQTSAYLKRIRIWSEESSQIFCEILRSAYSVSFIATKHINDYFYGDLECTRVTSVSDVLVDLGFGIREDERQKKISTNGHMPILDESLVEPNGTEKGNIDPIVSTDEFELNTCGNNSKNESDDESNGFDSNVVTAEDDMISGIVDENIETGDKAGESPEQSMVGRNGAQNRELSPITEHTEPSENEISTEKSDENNESISNATEDGNAYAESSWNSFVYRKMSSSSSSTLTLNEYVNASNGSSEVFDKRTPINESTSVDRFEMEIIASKPTDQHLFKVPMIPKKIEDDGNESVCSSVLSYLYLPSDTEEEPEKLQFTEEEFDKRDEEVASSNIQRVIDSKLKDATLCDEEPITNFDYKLLSSNKPESCKWADEALARSNNNNYAIQKKLWPQILNRESAILIGKTEFYPHLLYLPVVCRLIECLESNERNRKIVILASNQKQAATICRISACYLGDKPPSKLVYSNAENYTNNLDDEQFQICKIFVTLTSWFCNDSMNKYLEDALCIVVNDFETVAAEHRLQIMTKCSNTQFIITSNYCIRDFKRIMEYRENMFVSVENHYDLFLLTSEAEESRTINMQITDPQNSTMKLRSILREVKNLHSKRKTVVVCRNSKIAERISELLNSNNLNNILNRTPGGRTPPTLICSDDRLKEIGVTTADHIVHYDLPDDFETFSFRYSVFVKSHCNFQAMVAKERNIQLPTSKVLFILENTKTPVYDQKMKLLLSLLSRETIFSIIPKTRNKLLELAQRMNAEAHLCVDIAANFTNIDHLITCGNRHFYHSSAYPKAERFPKKTKAIVDICHVISPIHFTVRILEYEDLHGVRCSLVDSFKEFSETLNGFYRNAFKPVQNEFDLCVNQLYVLRSGDQFLRCQILETKFKSKKPGEIRVYLVDQGNRSRVNISDIGYLSEERFINHPRQSINLSLLELVPWNRREWNDYDTDYINELIFQTHSDETFVNGSFEITIECEMRPDSIFALDLISRNANANEIDNYAHLLISKGIATRSTDGLKEYFHHATQMNALMECF